MSLLAALLLSGTSVELDPAWQPVENPQALASNGQIQCLEPDVVGRTCLAMSWYKAAPGGETRFRTVYALSNQHGLAVQTSGAVRWEGDAACTKMDGTTFETSFLVKLAAPHARITDRRYFLYFREEAVQAFANQNVCGRTYRHRDTGDYLSVGTINGEFAGGLMQGFSLIDAEAGYRLRAAND